MTNEGGEEEDKIDSEGEFQRHVSLDQARDLAIQHARQNTEFYGSVFAGGDFVLEVISQLETADHYEVSLSYRPAGRFRGESGIEKFTIGKTGEIELRQILYELEGEAIKSPHPLLIGLAALVMIAGIAGIVYVVGDFGIDGTTPVPVAAVAVSATPTATATSMPTQTPTSVPPSATPTPVPSPTRTRTPTPTATPNPTATPAPLITQTPTPVTTPTITPTPIITATPTKNATPTTTPTATASPSPSPTSTPGPWYRLSLSIADGDLGTVEVAPVSVDKRYEAGTVVVLTARCLFDFVSWGGVVPATASPASATISVTMDRNRTLIASCSQPRATPTPSPTPTPGPALTLNTTQWEVAWFTLDQNELSLPLNITSTLTGAFSEYPVGQFIGFRASATIHTSPAMERIAIELSGKDGFLLWVDDKLVINAWESLTSGDRFRSERAVVALPSGTHTLDLEWYVLEAGATASFSVDEPHALAWCELEESTREATRTSWDAQWYESRELIVPVRAETFTATFDMTLGNLTQAFVATTEIHVSGEDEQFLEFQIGNDDGAMLSLDGKIIFDDWEGGPYGVTEVGALLSPGNHSLELRYWNQATFLGNSRVSFDMSASDVFLWCE